MRKALVLLIITQVLFQNHLVAQSDHDAVKSVISSLFEGMKTKNPEMIIHAFHKEAIMHTVINGAEETRLGSNSVNDFVNRIATTPAETQLEERILDYQISIDGDLASAWTPYEFYINDSFSHCGVNSFQLIKMEQGWKITYIIDTRRKEGCNSQ
jgi:hypothetical protein